MTFLELVQKLQTRTGTGGNTQIAQVTTATGDALRLVQYIRDAWNEIQAKRKDWTFRWAEMAQQLNAGADTYDIRTLLNVGQIRLQHGERYTLEPVATPTDYGVLAFLHFEYFRECFPRVASVAGRPTSMTILPSTKLRFNCPLDVNYTLRGPYHIVRQNLAANADVPIVDDEYHDAIFHLGLKKWAEFEEAWDVYKTAEADYDAWLAAMIAELTPKVTRGAKPLA